MVSSTVGKGNSFRDTVGAMLAAAGFDPESEVRAEWKKADIRWNRQDIDGPVRYFVEAKDYERNLTKPDCQEFVADYSPLIQKRYADRAWLISNSEISPDGRALIEADPNLRCMTFTEFQRRLLGIDAYLQNLMAEYDNDHISEWYVPLFTDDEKDLESFVRDWIAEPQALPLAIVAGYGKGKSTFAKHLSASLAQEALENQTRPVPILIRLGDIQDEQSLEGLLGKEFTSRPGITNYNFGLFRQLNRVGRFVTIFDGFDEMKHGMTLPQFQKNIRELMRLDEGNSKVLILGRHTAFQSDDEFRAIIHGRQTTAGGHEVPTLGQRPFQEVRVRDFRLEEAHRFVEKFFPFVFREMKRVQPSAKEENWIKNRTQELLSGYFDSLLVRPVHAQMLCMIATDQEISLADLSRYALFDRFVHFLLDREVDKKGRDSRFTLDVRRRFNANLAVWLWEQGGASTVSLSSVPAVLCKDASSGVFHDLDEISLRRELISGCLVEKGAETIYFSHRSLQEFLVAETLLETSLLTNWSVSKADPIRVLSYLNPEIISFILDAMEAPRFKNSAVEWVYILRGVRHQRIPKIGMTLFVELAKLPGFHQPSPKEDPWFVWLSYFIANGIVEFIPSETEAKLKLIDLLNEAHNESRDFKLSALKLLANVLPRLSEDDSDLVNQLVAKWLRPSSIKEALRAESQIKGKDIHTIEINADIMFWMFLKSSVVEPPSPDPKDQNNPIITIDLKELRARINSILPIGFSDELEELAETEKLLSVRARDIYSYWNLNTGELDRVRPFFVDKTRRRRIRPFEFVVKSTIRMEADAEINSHLVPEDSRNARNKLTLKQLTKFKD